MATRNMQYDHPAYTTPYMVSKEITAGSGTTVRFAAFADSIAMALVLKPTVVSTSADTVTAYAVTNTTTKTLGVTTIASAQSTFSRLEFTTASRTLTRGDEIRIVKGTDATVVYAAAVELLTTPGADVSA
jgi:hypothetical protein